MLQYLHILLDKAAPSFCFYKVPADQESGPISMEHLEKAIRFAESRKLAIHFIYPRVGELPEKTRARIETVPHLKIVPFEDRFFYPDAIPVMDHDRKQGITGLKLKRDSVLVLRLNAGSLDRLEGILQELKGKFKRLNLIITDLDQMDRDALERYQEILGDLAGMVWKKYRKGKRFELNFLTDRLFLSSMRNCDAGVRHITFAPDGNFYICPGFYADSLEQSSGLLDDRLEPPGGGLQKIDRSPVCSACDAFHCPRCVYLNHKTTLEINIPSKEQCISAHLERNASKNLLGKLMGLKEFSNLDPITDIEYLDPLQKLTGRRGTDGKSR